MNLPLNQPRLVARSRASRRGVVVALYGSFAATLALLIAEVPAGSTASIAHASLLLLGVAATVGAWVVLYRTGRRLGDDEDRVLDERQLAIRNDAYLQAYRLVAGGFVLFAVYLSFASKAGLPMPTGADDWSRVLWSVLLLTLTIPSAILLWSEPDPMGGEGEAEERPSPAAGDERADRSATDFPWWAMGLVAAMTVLVLPGCSSVGGDVGRTAAPAPAPVDAALAVATFDSAWSRIHNTYYDPAFGGLDWGAVRDELRPRAEAAGTDAELRAVIMEMTSRLGDSHFGIIPRETADALSPDAVHAGNEGPPADAGFEMRLVDGALVVARVREGGPAEAAGVRTGWVVEAIEGRETQRWLAALDGLDGEAARAARIQATFGAAGQIQGEAGTPVRIRFTDDQGRAVERAIPRATVPGEPVRFGNLPTLFAELEQRRLPSEGGCIGVIRFNTWMVPMVEPFADAMDGFAGCEGVVIDLRGNLGGVAGMIMGTSGFFLPDVRPLGIMRTRQSELRLVSMPRRSTRAGERTEPYAGPVAILIDGLSASTSEFFAMGLQAHGRARVFGETSAGQALPAMMIRLPNDDVLMHAFADYTGPDGTRIEGRGVVPDQSVPLTRDDLLAGRDAPLDAALRWIRSQE